MLGFAACCCDKSCCWLSEFGVEGVLGDWDWRDSVEKVRFEVARTSLRREEGLDLDESFLVEADRSEVVDLDEEQRTGRLEWESIGEGVRR